MYFNVNFNVFFKLMNVNLLVSELDIYQKARCSDKLRPVWQHAATQPHNK